MYALTLAMLIPSGFAQNRIVNGTDVTSFDLYPEVVFVEGARGNCTGSLIHPEWILTAAHCFDDILVGDTAGPADPITGIGTPTNGGDSAGGSPLIVFGYDAGNPAAVEESVTANRVIVHEDYEAIGSQSMNGPASTSGGTVNDIALVHLSVPVARQVMAVNTEPMTDDWIGRPLTFIGFGITEFEGGGGGTKRWAEIPIQSYEELILNDFDPDTQSSTCQGDSGGPGVYYQGAGYIQVSVTAYGVECGTTPGSHMRVDAYVDWFEETLPEGVQLLKEAASPPSIACSHQLDPEAEQTIALGVVPMDLRCEVVSSEPETVTEVEWSWGDGSEPEVIPALRGLHTYNEMGVYSLGACIRGDRDGLEYESCVTRPNHVNACGIPEVSFEAEQGDGLSIDLFNTTPLRAYTCITNAKWEVYEGEGTGGAIVAEYSNWDPTVELEAPGTYTIVLNVGGLGGTGGAMTTVKVGSGIGCSTAPGWAPTFLLPFALLGLRRRR